jgi:hypothetical protein
MEIILGALYTCVWNCIPSEVAVLHICLAIEQLCLRLSMGKKVWQGFNEKENVVLTL